MTKLRPLASAAPPRCSVRCEPMRCHVHSPEEMPSWPGTTSEGVSSRVQSPAPRGSSPARGVTTASIDEDEEIESDADDEKPNHDASSSAGGGLGRSAAERARKRGDIFKGKYIIDPNVQIITAGGQGDVVVVVDGAGGKHSGT